MSVVEDVRKRLLERAKELRERLRLPALAGRTKLLRGESRGQVFGPGGLVGGGRIIEHISGAVDRTLAAIKEKRPNIIPTVVERIKTYEPGKRIKEIVPTAAEKEEKAPPSTPQKSKLLRG